ncbi:hypothetical protein FRB90_009073 [Tulasnella sp. 427]|nr:hypothetical protein FRB90_009073 [Tulasnella sp. 427]
MRLSVTLFTSLLIFSASTSPSVIAAPIAFRFSREIAEAGAHIPRSPAPEPIAVPELVALPDTDVLAVVVETPKLVEEKRKRIVAPLTNAERLARGLPPASPASFVKRAIGNLMQRNLPKSDATQVKPHSHVKPSSQSNEL